MSETSAPQSREGESRTREILEMLKDGAQIMLQMGQFGWKGQIFTAEEANSLLQSGLAKRCFPMGFDAIQITTEGCDFIGAPYFRDVDPKWDEATKKVWDEKSRYNQEGGDEATIVEHFKTLHEITDGTFAADLTKAFDGSRDEFNAKKSAAGRRVRTKEQDDEMIVGLERNMVAQAMSIIEHLVERVAELESGFPRREEEWAADRKEREEKAAAK